MITGLENLSESVIKLNEALRKNSNRVDILGTKYEIVTQKVSENPKLENANGLCEYYSKKIVIRDFEDERKDAMCFENLEEFEQKVLRHEIIHAFLAESGLRSNSDWAENEEMVDWFAIQFPKILKAFIDSNALPNFYTSDKQI